MLLEMDHGVLGRDSHPKKGGDGGSQIDWLLDVLRREFGLPGAWGADRIRRSRLTHGLMCAELLSEHGEPFLIAVAATLGHVGTAESLLRELLQASPALSVGICTDGSPTGTLLLRKKHSTGEIGHARELDKLVDPGLTATTAFCLPRDGKREHRATRGRALLPLSSRLESLFYDVHSHMRDIDGLHADEALDELTKLLHIKILDEKQCQPGARYRLQSALYSCSEEFAVTARTMYDRLQAERQSSVADTIRLSTSALVKSLGCLEQYDISGSPADVKGRAFQRVLGPAARSGMGQYFTPSEVVRFMVAVIAPSKGEIVIDPFCGSAHFLEQSVAHWTAKLAERKASSKKARSVNIPTAIGIEKSERMARIASMDAALRDDGNISITCADSLLDFRNYKDLRPGIADAVITNPPFGSLLGPETIKTLGAFDLAAGGGSVALEVLGLERSVQFLRPGGRLGIVLPEGLLSNTRASGVRQWLETKMKVRAIVALPAETFAPFGANVRTCIVFARRWHPGESTVADYNVALVRSDGVGYDASGRPANSDLAEVQSKLQDFLSQEGW